MVDVPASPDGPDLVHAVSVVGRRDPHLALIAGTLGRTHRIESVEVDLSEVADHLTGEAGRTYELFDHTPQPLIDAWLLARAVAGCVPDGSTVLVPDVAGVGGVLALTESQRPEHLRRRIWSVAGAGTYLAEAATFGTTDHLALPRASEVDWELVQYRHSARVLATSRLARRSLDALGVAADLAVDRTAGTPGALAAPATHVFAPGAVSRRNRTGDVMRAVADRSGTRLTVSDRDVPDAVWEGTTWEANRAIRAILGDRLARSVAVPPDADIVVVGDPGAPPDPELHALRAAGTPIAAPAASVVATLWSEVRTWTTSDDLSGILAGREPVAEATVGTPDAPGPVATADATRAQRVSVGIPAFGPPVHLDECLASVLDQSQPVAEVVVIDDGSRSEDLDRSLARWAGSDDRVRILRQPNRGVCVARNTMLDAMTGDAFLLVDQDDVLRHDFVAATASALRADTELAAVATWTEFFGDYSAIEAKPPFDARVAHRENPIVSTAVLVDMAVRDGGIRFEPDLAFLFCEDWNFWSQIVASGRRMGLVPAPLVRHRVHRASGGFQRTELAHRIGKARALAPFERSD